MRGIRLFAAQILASLLISGLQVTHTNATGRTKILCDCSVDDGRSSKVVVSCSKKEGEGLGLSCTKALVPRISRGYRYVPGYGLFRLFKTAQISETAQRTCQGEGANLYIPEDSQLTVILSNIYDRIEFLTGLSDAASEGVFVGVDKKVYVDLKWAPDEPNGQRGENCATVVHEGLLNDVRCGSAYAFVCQRQLTALPPDGYVYSDGFGFFKLYGDKKSFEDAQRTCERDGGNLAVPETYEGAEALMTVVNEDRRRVNDLWIGLNDTVQEGRFTTVTGRPLSSMGFNNWRPHEPNGLNIENCVVFYNDGTINDDNCDGKHNFICELSLEEQ